MFATNFPPEDHSDRPVATLGDLLYADRAKTHVAESEWYELVRSIARGDQFALRALCEGTLRLVFTLIMRITHDRAAAEDVTIDVYYGLWQRASQYDPADGSVVGWVMNEARSHALDWLHFEQGDKRIDRYSEDPVSAPAASESAQRLVHEEQRRVVQEALRALSRDERDAIEAAFLSESTYAEVAATLNQPAEIVRKRIGSGLAKLRRALGGKIGESSSPATSKDRCPQNEHVFLYGMRVLAPGEMFFIGAHVSACSECRQELEALGRVTDAFAFWPTDLLRPWAEVWRRLSRRISDENRNQPALVARRHRTESAWQHVAPGIFCKLLSTDTEKHRVSMLVRLKPGVAYPPHRHAGVEELHLLHGELWIDDRKLYAGDFNRAEPGTSDARVWSETGCTCVLITSPLDELR